MSWMPILAGIIPSIGVGLLFWFAMRSLLRADRNERAALAQADDEREENKGLPKEGGANPTEDGISQ